MRQRNNRRFERVPVELHSALSKASDSIHQALTTDNRKDLLEAAAACENRAEEIRKELKILKCEEDEIKLNNVIESDQEWEKRQEKITLLNSQLALEENTLLIILQNETVGILRSDENFKNYYNSDIVNGEKKSEDDLNFNGETVGEWLLFFRFEKLVGLFKEQKINNFSDLSKVYDESSCESTLLSIKNILTSNEFIRFKWAKNVTKQLQKQNDNSNSNNDKNKKDKTNTLDNINKSKEITDKKESLFTSSSSFSLSSYFQTFDSNKFINNFMVWIIVAVIAMCSLFMFYI